MEYRVEILPAAVIDAEEAYLWWCKSAPSRAAAWYHRLVDALVSLETFPTRCPLARESEDLGMEVRQLLYGKGPSTYRILLRVVEPTWCGCCASATVPAPF